MSDRSLVKVTTQCHRCSQTVKYTKRCEACIRNVCVDCKDKHANLCIDCKTELNEDPKKFYEYMSQGDPLEKVDDPIGDLEYGIGGSFEDLGEGEPYDDIDPKDSPFEGEEGQEEYVNQEEDYYEDLRAWEEKCLREEEEKYLIENKESLLAQEESQEIGIGKDEIIRLSKKYYREHYEDWIRKEIELREKIRKAQEINLEDLIEINEWKFKKTNPDVWKENLSRIIKNSDQKVRQASREVFLLPSRFDEKKIRRLYMNGVGNSLASVILSLHNPEEYGIFDKHVWQALFGDMPPDKYEFSKNPFYYMNVLSRLRFEADIYNLEVRTVEQAYFKKHFDPARAGMCHK